ncbi:hypothetical protein T484DRAFT_1818151 [Baffinella frigidus]|nr:hypothetical protein T484DRAFT_1818151 [Cryptophyta sp. CCMP2293]
MEAARPRALAAGLLVSALVLLVAHGRGGGERGGATVELDQKAQSKSESVGQQLLKAQKMFDGAGSAPPYTTNSKP